MNPLSPTAVALLLVLAAAIAFVSGTALQQRADGPQLKRLAELDNLYRNIQGVNAVSGPFRIVTIDGGKKWHAVSGDYDTGFTVLGPAEEHCPEALGMHLLSERAWTRGPIDPADPEGRALLQRAGFTVSRRKTP